MLHFSILNISTAYYATHKYNNERIKKNKSELLLIEKIALVSIGFFALSCLNVLTMSISVPVVITAAMGNANGVSPLPIGSIMFGLISFNALPYLLIFSPCIAGQAKRCWQLITGN